MLDIIMNNAAPFKGNPDKSTTASLESQGEYI